MSNSQLVNYKKISPNKTSPRSHKIDTITIHCVVGQCSVETLGSIFAQSSRQASSNYGIGVDGRIGMYVEEKDRSWCSSSSENDNRAITIECASDTTHPYAINDKVYKSLIDLLEDICKRNGIEKLVWSTDKNKRMKHLDGCNMTVHRDYANKACPGDYIYNRLGKIAAEVNERLEGNDMTQEKFDQMFATAMNSYRAGLQTNNAQSYSSEAREWAKKNGLIQGSSSGAFNGMWQDFLSREQFVTILYRFAKLIGKA